MTSYEDEAMELRRSHTAFEKQTKKICSTYVRFGAWWFWKRGWRTTCPQQFKLLSVMWVHGRVWNIIRLSQLTELQTDCLCFLMFGILPDSLMRRMMCSTWKEFWDVLLENYYRLKQEEANRMQEQWGVEKY